MSLNYFSSSRVAYFDEKCTLPSVSPPGCLGSAPAELPGTPAAVPGLWGAHSAGVAEVAQCFTFLPPSSFLGLIGLSVGIQVLFRCPQLERKRQNFSWKAA